MGKMSATVVLIVIFAVMIALVHAKDLYQYKLKSLNDIKSPKRQSVRSLLLGGRFGRSCLLKAGGCLGKRSKNWPIATYNTDDGSDDVPNEINFSSIIIRDEAARNFDKDDNQRVARFQRLFANEDKLQRTPDLDYSNFYLQ